MVSDSPSNALQILVCVVCVLPGQAASHQGVDRSFSVGISAFLISQDIES
jgi:hypothetical protein